MRIKRTIPPTAAPISPTDLLYGFYGIANKKLNEKLERELKEYFGATHAFLVSSGKAALFLILSGLKKLTRKRKVIVPAYTCFSVPSAIRMAGLEIVVCDVRPETLDFDFSQLRDLIDDDTMCVISTHLFGVPADVSKVRDLCEHRKIFIIEDAAQAMGAVSGRGKLGTFGDVAFFSLGRGKNITCGSGGIIITSAEDIVDSIRKDYADLEKVPMIEYMKYIVEIVFMMCFLRPELYWLPKSLPFLKIGETRFYRTFPVRKFTGFQAGLLFDWRKKLEALNRSRSGNADGYIEGLELSDGLQIYANGIPYNRFPIYLEGKESKDVLCASGDRIGISPMYPFPIHRIQEIREHLDHRDFGGAETISDTLVTLPTHILLNEKDKLMIREAVKEVFRHEQRNEHDVRQGVGCQ
jgi:dTDP-4-amino-4,6-dideoxygalactose transaminase